MPCKDLYGGRLDGRLEGLSKLFPYKFLEVCPVQHPTAVLQREPGVLLRFEDPETSIVKPQPGSRCRAVEVLGSC